MSKVIVRYFSASKSLPGASETRALHWLNIHHKTCGQRCLHLQTTQSPRQWTLRCQREGRRSRYVLLSTTIVCQLTRAPAQRNLCERVRHLEEAVSETRSCSNLSDRSSDGEFAEEQWLEWLSSLSYVPYVRCGNTFISSRLCCICRYPLRDEQPPQQCRGTV
jgi:hypothetical protein